MLTFRLPVKDLLALLFARVMSGSNLDVRMRAPHFRTYLEKDSTDCADIWCVVGDQLAWCFAQAVSGSHLHVRTCALYFNFSTKAGRILLKFHVW